MKKTLLALLFLPLLAFSQTNKNYISLGYSSVCCGTPSEKPVIDFIKQFEKKNKLKPFEIYLENGFGKEGEFAIYIGTDNLNSKQLHQFWEGLKTTAASQNSHKDQNQSGSVNLDEKLTANSVLKNLKEHPTTRISSLKKLDYKKIK